MSFNLNEILDRAVQTAKEKYSGTDEEFDKKVKSKLAELTHLLGDAFKEGLLKYYKSNILKELRDKEKKYADNLFEDYKKGFDFLQIFIDLNKYCGKRNLELYDKQNDKNESLKQMLLYRIQSRACLVASEVQTLLRFGYPDGAHARWRTIHELSVIFLVLFDNPLRLSEMYMDYNIIEKLKRAEDFEDQRHKINWRALDKNELDKLLVEKELLISKYGKEFKDNYGWTLEILPKGKRNFRELEKLAGLDYWRPFYSWSNDNVHAGINGLIKRMGQIDKGKTSYLKNAGPSFYGFADPVQFTSSSLLIITNKILETNRDLESQVIYTLLDELDKEIKDAFFETQLELKRKHYGE
jgi:hypothetical protein